MTVTETDGTREYRCNDGAPDDDFDDIVFSVAIVKRSDYEGGETSMAPDPR